MNVTQLRYEMRDMGFEDDTIFYDETFMNTFYSGTTRALKVIATTVKAPIGSYDLEYSVVFADNLNAQLSAHGKTREDLINDLGFDEKTVTEWLEGEKIPATDTIKKIAEYLGVEKSDLLTGRYDLSELIKNENNETIFDSIDRVVVNTDTGIKTFADYDFVQGKVLIIDPARLKSIYEGDEDTITVYYNQRILPITSSTDETTALPIEYECEPLLALLTAHYIWLDDDERKAITYYNEFDSLKQEILANVSRPRARIVV